MTKCQPPLVKAKKVKYTWRKSGCCQESKSKQKGELEWYCKSGHVQMPRFTYECSYTYQRLRQPVCQCLNASRRYDLSGISNLGTSQMLMSRVTHMNEYTSVTHISACNNLCVSAFEERINIQNVLFFSFKYLKITPPILGI